jgi:hypothetical protein
MKNSTEVCLQLSPDEVSTFETFKWWIDDVSERAVGLAGLLANLAAIFILTRTRMLSNFSLLLTFLAACDFSFIFFSLLEGVESNLGPKL